MVRWLFSLTMVLILIGCSDKDSSDQKVAPSETPAPTSALSVYGGPLLNTPNPDHHAENCSINNPDGECGVAVGNVEENALPLPLISQNVLGIEMGIPEGFEILENNENEVIIETDDEETFPGDFFVIIQLGTANDVETLLNRYAKLDYDRQVDYENRSETLNGYRLPNSDLGMVAIVVLDQELDQYLMMQGIVLPGYWGKYEATFVEMTKSVEILTPASS